MIGNGESPVDSPPEIQVKHNGNVEEEKTSSGYDKSKCKTVDGENCAWPFFLAGFWFEEGECTLFGKADGKPWCSIKTMRRVCIPFLNMDQRLENLSME